MRQRRRFWVIAIASLALLPRAGRSQSWQDAKNDLTARGLTPSIVYDGLLSSTISGGAKRGSTYTGNLHIQLSLDGDKLLGLPDATAFFDGLWITGGQPSDNAGDAQGVSNIAGPHRFKFYEAWVQQNFDGARFSALAGLYDLNTEFYRLQSAGLFLNGSFGIGPEFGQSGVAGPSIFPNTAVGARVAYKPAPNIV